MESAENDEKDYWEQQAEKPLRKRGRGWWIEVGFSNIIWIVAVIAAVLLLIFT